MSLHSKVECRAKIGEQDLSTAPDEEIAGLDILMNEAILVDVEERGCGLFYVWHKLFGVCKSPTAIFSAKEVMDSFRRVLHYQVRTSVCKLAEVIDRQNIGMLQVGDTLRLVKKAVLALFVELIYTQYLER
jgi:hypothetical protein